MKKSRGSSARGARAAKSEKGIKSKKINFSDIPERSNSSNCFGVLRCLLDKRFGAGSQALRWHNGYS